MILKFTSGTQECVPFFYSVDFYFANRNYSLLIIHYSLKKRHFGDDFCHFTMLPFLAD